MLTKCAWKSFPAKLSSAEIEYDFREDFDNTGRKENSLTARAEILKFSSRSRFETLYESSTVIKLVQYHNWSHTVESSKVAEE